MCIVFNLLQFWSCEMGNQKNTSVELFSSEYSSQQDALKMFLLLRICITFHVLRRYLAIKKQCDSI